MSYFIGMKTTKKKVVKKRGKLFDIKLKIYEDSEFLTLNVAVNDNLQDIKLFILPIIDERERKNPNAVLVMLQPEDESEEAKEERAMAFRVTFDGKLLEDENLTCQEMGIVKDSVISLLQPPPQSGSGIFTYPNGAIYKGEWALSGGRKLRHGQGRLTNGGEVYEGEWFKDRINGLGKYTFATGTVYEGHLLDYTFHGHGTLRWPSGASYSGNWANNRMHGAGTFTHESGDQFMGQFENNKFLNHLGHWIPVPDNYAFLPRDPPTVTYKSQDSQNT